MSEMHYWTKQEAMAFPQSPKIHLGTEGPNVSWKLQPRFHVCTNISVNRQHMAGNIAELAIYKKENYENIQPNAKTVNVFKKKKKKSIKEKHQCHASPFAAWITWFGDTSAQWEDALVPLISW